MKMTDFFIKYTKYIINGYVYVKKISQFMNDLWHVIQGQQTLSARDVQIDME